LPLLSVVTEDGAIHAIDVLSCVGSRVVAIWIEDMYNDNEVYRNLA
jgi:hypothetical protein